jgi:2-deoxy-D-gluconate 3-dehydrogenase
VAIVKGSHSETAAPMFVNYLASPATQAIFLKTRIYDSNAVTLPTDYSPLWIFALSRRAQDRSVASLAGRCTEGPLAHTERRSSAMEAQARPSAALVVTGIELRTGHLRPAAHHAPCDIISAVAEKTISILDRFRLDKKTALVTGAASGLGAAIAIALAEAGADVACHGNRRPAEETSARIRSLGRDSMCFAADLNEADGAARLFEEVKTAMGAPNILVNNAGMIYRERAEDYKLDAWMKVVQVNLNSVFRLCQLAGREMLNREEGKIINIASLLSFQGGIHVPAYAASKGGVAQLTKALSNEWASHNVQVNAIAPGYFSTENTSALRADETRERQILERIPAGRWGDPEDLAGAAVFLASPASDYVTGQILLVDGGWMAR